LSITANCGRGCMRLLSIAHPGVSPARKLPPCLLPRLSFASGKSLLLILKLSHLKPGGKNKHESSRLSVLARRRRRFPDCSLCGVGEVNPLLRLAARIAWRAILAQPDVWSRLQLAVKILGAFWGQWKTLSVSGRVVKNAVVSSSLRNFPPSVAQSLFATARTKTRTLGCVSIGTPIAKL
jgi:hypothetical protein